MRPIRIAALLALGACPVTRFDEDTPLLPRLRAVEVDGAPVVWYRATWDIRLFRLHACPQPPLPLDWPTLPEATLEVPALPMPGPASVGFGDPVPMLARDAPRVLIGPWCGLDVVQREALEAEGIAEASGARITLSVVLPDLGAVGAAPFGRLQDVATTVGEVEVVVPQLLPLLLEVGTEGWLDPVAGDLAAGTDVDLGPDHPAYAQVQEALGAARLFVDADDDRTIDPDERADVALTLTPL